MHITGKFTNEHLICNAAERLYLYSNSTQINAQTGFQGYLRGDFDNVNRDKLHHEFFPFKTPVDTRFSDALQMVMKTLREGILRSFDAMRSFCYSDGYDGKVPSAYGEQVFAFRLDSGNYAFFFRLYPMAGMYHIYCYGYQKDWLEQHMKKAESGIRFIDSNYQEKFRLEDGGKIRVISHDIPCVVENKPREYACRYIDDYHVEIGGNLYHICEYAEFMETNGRTIEPVSGKM